MEAGKQDINIVTCFVFPPSHSTFFRKQSILISTSTIHTTHLITGVRVKDSVLVIEYFLLECVFLLVAVKIIF